MTENGLRSRLLEKSVLVSSSAARASNANDEYSIAELFHEHHAYVARFLKYNGAPSAELEDLVQEVFLVAHRRGFAPGPASPRTWLTHIAIRIASGHRRSQRRHRERPDDDAIAEVPFDGPGPQRSAELHQSIARVQQCLDQLTDKERTVFVLSEIMGESGQAMAELLEVPLGTVYRRLHAARQRLHAAYARLSKED